jgi:serine/threonine protein kinase/Tol biopolymer transport system component
MALASGTKLGPYEIQSAIGAGGMGEVYRARDTRLNRTVAVKILPAHLSTDSAARQRFDREARVISSLNHPNICHLYDVGSQDGVDFIVMEFLDGETLADRLKKGPMPLEQVLKCGIEICEGLEKAHKSGVVHRDLKPGNIMLTKSGAKLMDFGLAKAMEVVKTVTATATVGMAGDGSPLTAQGTVVGTFQYMSPEQVEGKEADPRSDIFALGAVLYEMATGKRAFEGKTTASVIAAVLERDPAPVSVLQPASPPAFDGVVRACLAKDPDERFQSIHDLKLELRWIAEAGSHAGALPAVKSKLRNRLLGAAALVLAAIGGGLGHAYFRGAVDGPLEVRSSILPPDNLSFLTGVSTSGFALSNDGTRLAFCAQSVDGKMGLWVRSLSSTAAQELVGSETGAFPFWSPDGRWIAFFAGGKLKKVPSSGGAVQVICDAPLGRGGAWSPQGVIVFAPSTAGPLYRVSGNGGLAAPATRLDASLGETTHRWPDFLPDGVHFLYVGRQLSDKQAAGVYAGSLDSLLHKKVLDSLTEAHYVAPGYLVFARKTTLLAQPFDAGNLNLTGDAVPIVQDASIQSGALRSGFSVSQAGHLTYAGSNIAADLEFIVTDRSGRRLSSLETPGIPAHVRISPDEHKVAVSVVDLDSENSTIWLYDLGSGLSERFTFAGGKNLNPVWSPDGSQLALTSSRTGSQNVYLKSATGAAEEQPLHPTGTEEDERVQSWSPDGRYLVLDSRPQSRLAVPQIAILPLTGDHKPFLYINSPYASSSGQVSPNGHWLAYASNESGRGEVYVSSFPQAKGKWQVSFTGGQFPLWRKDGRELFYCTLDGALMEAEITPGKDSFVVGSRKQMFDRRIYQNSLGATYDIFADGQRLIISGVKPQPMHAPLTLVTNWTAELRK